MRQTCVTTRSVRQVASERAVTLNRRAPRQRRNRLDQYPPCHPERKLPPWLSKRQAKGAEARNQRLR